jgi:peptidyl-tRNA hydrolase
MKEEIRVYYNKTLGMSEGKIASQVAHAVAGLCDKIGYNRDMNIIVLGKRNKSFIDLYEVVESGSSYMQVDKGLTEVGEGTKTAFAFLRGS